METVYASLSLNNCGILVHSILKKIQYPNRTNIYNYGLNVLISLSFYIGLLYCHTLILFLRTKKAGDTPTSCCTLLLTAVDPCCWKTRTYLFRSSIQLHYPSSISISTSFPNRDIAIYGTRSQGQRSRSNMPNESR